MAKKHEILMVGAQTQALVDVSEYLDDSLYSVFFAQARKPIDYLLEHGNWQPAGAIVRLTGQEGSEDFLPVFQAYPSTSFLFLAAGGPLDEDARELVRRYGGDLIDPLTRSPQGIVEDLAALMFHHKLD